MSKDLLVLADEYAAATATFARALALKDEADSMSPIAREAGDKRAVLAEAIAALDTAQPALSGCACRWDADDKRVATCVRHQGWLDVVSEWAERAKAAESQQAQPEREPLTDAEIEQAVKTHGVCWAGYREDKHGFYTIPILMPYHYQFARAIEAATASSKETSMKKTSEQELAAWEAFKSRRPA